MKWQVIEINKECSVNESWEVRAYFDNNERAIVNSYEGDIECTPCELEVYSCLVVVPPLHFVPPCIRAMGDKMVYNPLKK